MAETKVVATRIPMTLVELVQEYIDRDTHLSHAEFFRDAIREKIRRDAPDLYAQLFKESDS